MPPVGTPVSFAPLDNTAAFALISSTRGWAQALEDVERLKLYAQRPGLSLDALTAHIILHEPALNELAPALANYWLIYWGKQAEDAQG